eukprot:3034287-Karenia_brevis.AAC.1
MVGLGALDVNVFNATATVAAAFSASSARARACSSAAFALAKYSGFSGINAGMPGGLKPGTNKLDGFVLAGVHST